MLRIESFASGWSADMFVNSDISRLSLLELLPSILLSYDGESALIEDIAFIMKWSLLVYWWVTNILFSFNSVLNSFREKKRSLLTCGLVDYWMLVLARTS